jgi:hypothetical protein
VDYNEVVAAVHAAAVNGRVNIQMARGPWPMVDNAQADLTQPHEAHPPTVNGRYVTPGPTIETDEQSAAIAIFRGDATLA